MEKTNAIELTTSWDGWTARQTQWRMTHDYFFLPAENKRWGRLCVTNWVWGTKKFNGDTIQLTQERTFTLPNGQTARYVWIPDTKHLLPIYEFQLNRLGIDAFFREVVENHIVHLLQKTTPPKNWTELEGFHRFYLVMDGTETFSERIVFNQKGLSNIRKVVVWKGYRIHLGDQPISVCELKEYPRIDKEKLVQSVFHPDRLFRMMEKYGDDWAERV
jgi:hypothetical protein